MKNVLPVLVALAATPGVADPPQVVAVEIDGTRVSVTIAHPDTGWQHYADGWRIEDAAGNVIGIRELLHPHETEQPFTRTLSVDSLPGGPLFIRARCSVNGWSEDRVAFGS